MHLLEVVGVSKPSVIGGLFKIAGNSRGFQKPPGIAGFSKLPRIVGVFKTAGIATWIFQGKSANHG